MKVTTEILRKNLGARTEAATLAKHRLLTSSSGLVYQTIRNHQPEMDNTTHSLWVGPLLSIIYQKIPTVQSSEGIFLSWTSLIQITLVCVKWKKLTRIRHKFYN